MFEIASNADALTASLTKIVERQLPFAMSRALNDTAKDVREAVRVHMGEVFDSPVPFTLNAFQIRPATKDHLAAVVEQKATSASRDYLKTEESGGPRQKTAFETLVGFKLPYERTVLQAIIPADGARLDRYGNWSAGQRNQVLASIHAMRDPYSNTSSASRKRNPRRATYFVPQHGLTPGIYQRVSKTEVLPVAIFTAAVPRYSPRLKFHETASSAALSVFERHFTRRFFEALATAR